jgi:hypothetical protein
MYTSVPYISAVIAKLEILAKESRVVKAIAYQQAMISHHLFSLAGRKDLHHLSILCDSAAGYGDMVFFLEQLT